MKENQDIGKIFSNKLKNYQVSTDESDWLKISSKLNRSNFFRFSIVTFNIYYLAIFLVFAGTTTYTGIRNHALLKKVEHLQQTIEKSKKFEESEYYIDNEVIDSIILNPDIQLKHEELDSLPIIENKKKITSNAVKLIETSKIKAVKDSFTINADTIKSIPNIAPDTLIINKKVKRVKKTVYIKPSSIMKRDTVIISKPK